MKRKKECVAMLLAGGQGSRLLPLTKVIAKPAIPFGARYRIIDFSLSNCFNSEIDTVGVLTQYQPMELNDYLGNGDSWDMNLRFGGLHKLPPYQAEKDSNWFKGTANAIYQNMRFINSFSPDYVIVLSGDHIYKMDYRIMLEEHIANRADCTIAVIDVPPEEAGRFGIMNTDERGRITEFEEKPAHPKSTQASMGVYIFSTDKLRKYLEEDERDPDSDNDFGKNVIPRMLADGQRMFAYLYKGYWRDVGTLDSYWAANMDAIGDNPEMNLNDPGWRIYYRHGFEYPTYLGEKTKINSSILGDGNEINGEITSSVIFNNIVIDENAFIRDSIIMNKVRIGKNVRIDYAVIGSGTVIEDGAVIGGSRDKSKLTVIADSLRIGGGVTIPPGEIVEEDRKKRRTT